MLKLRNLRRLINPEITKQLEELGKQKVDLGKELEAHKNKIAKVSV